MRKANYLCVSSFIGYLAYGLLAAVQVHFGFAEGPLMAWNTGLSLTCCLVIYGLIRSGLAARWRFDPTLGRTQLALGILFFLTTYALSGPAAPATTIIVASHLVYAMFGMPSRQVWHLAAGSLLVLGLVMLACHAAMPLRYPAGQQSVTWLYTTLVAVLIAQLASRVTQMQASLREQRRQLAQALVQVRQLAECDELTRLPNRRTTTETLAQAWQQAPEAGSVGCLALLDIDHFKRVNDQLGHAMGDRVLRCFANTCRAAVRDSDHLGRWGGEEFLLFMPNADAQVASHVLLRLRAAVALQAFGPGDVSLPVSFSAGVAVHDPQERIEACIERADQALYRAKAAGRDRAEFAPRTGAATA